MDDLLPINVSVAKRGLRLTLRQEGVIMKSVRTVLAIALATGTMISGAALADHGHGHGGIVWGINLGVPMGPWYYPPYSYPYPPWGSVPVYPNVVAAQPSPPVYIEKGGEAAGPSAPASGYWYYCPDSQGYYPYVKECQSGWMSVLPQAPGQPGPR
jgi:hypothetical protein